MLAEEPNYLCFWKDGGVSYVSNFANDAHLDHLIVFSLTAMYHPTDGVTYSWIRWDHSARKWSFLPTDKVDPQYKARLFLLGIHV